MAVQTLLLAKALIIDAQENVLVVRRSEKHPYSPFAPDLPGGQLEEDEEAHMAVSREIQEEVGLTIASDQLHLVFTSTVFQGGMSRIRNLFVAKIAAVTPDVQLSWEHDQFEWVPLSQVAAHLGESEYAKGAAYALAHNLIPAD